MTFVIASQLAEEISFLFFFNIHLRVYYNMLFPNTKEEDRTGSREWLRWGRGSEVGWPGGWAAQSRGRESYKGPGGPVTSPWLDFSENNRRGLGPFWGTPDARPLGWQKGWEG